MTDTKKKKQFHVVADLLLSVEIWEFVKHFPPWFQQVPIRSNGCLLLEDICYHFSS